MSKDYRLGLIAGVALAVAVVGALFATGTCEIVSSDAPTMPTESPTVAPTAAIRPTVAITALPPIVIGTPTPTPTSIPMRPAQLGDGGLR